MGSLASPAGDVFIVDDEPSICEVLSVAFEREGYRSRSFCDSATFLQVVRQTSPAFVLLDVNMPGRSGLDVLDELDAQTYPVPIFVISGYGDIPTAVDAIRRGALDFIEKPFDVDAVPARIRQTLASRISASTYVQRNLNHFAGYDLLTPREREVLGQIAGGASNKEAGRTLAISPRTVEVHRARIMEKLGARNAADLVRIVLTEGEGNYAARRLSGANRP